MRPLHYRSYGCKHVLHASKQTAEPVSGAIYHFHWVGIVATVLCGQQRQPPCQTLMLHLENLLFLIHSVYRNKGCPVLTADTATMEAAMPLRDVTADKEDSQTS